ncbi:MAG: hypothetical protein Ct9H300mP12_11840 [Acidimicrobiales bacterium]|nr:MAG: hypothetical protein Ct9H300mP12_11840 [Acidimicrobiales bacterium]
MAWQFERKGVVLLEGSVDEDEIMVAALDAGAEDLVDDDGTWRLTCEATDLPSVREALEVAEVPFLNADVTMLASTSVALESAEHARAVLRVMDPAGRQRRRSGCSRAQIRHTYRDPRGTRGLRDGRPDDC